MWCLKVSTLNGTVTMCTEVTLYPTKEMAEQVEKAVKEANYDKDLEGFGLYTLVEECNFYESLDEVPIIKNRNK